MGTAPLTVHTQQVITTDLSTCHAKELYYTCLLNEVRRLNFSNPNSIKLNNIVIHTSVIGNNH